MSQEDLDKSEERLLSFRFLSEIEKAMESHVDGALTKKELAQKVGTSPSYITQLFRGDRLINIPMLYKMLKAVEITIEITSRSSREEQIRR